MKKTAALLLFLLGIASGDTPSGVAEEEAPPRSTVVVLELTGVIDPALARYTARGLEQAREEKASAVVIRLDTPGGLDGSMRKIMQAILDSPVPVITYVAPAGARAASAGAFIVLASHVAAMAPGTNIGAAHPVQLGGSDAGGDSGSKESGEKEGKESSESGESVLEKKITSDAAAYIRAIAELRGRDVKWAEAAVRESRSSTAQEARKEGIVEIIAENMEDLLRQAEGRQVKTVFGSVVLSVEGQPLRTLPMSLMEKILHGLAHPNVAYILLLLGVYGLIYELATPGTVFPGVVGTILLVLGLVALETLEVNWAGMALIALAILFFVADIHLPGYGALTLGGLVAFVLGSMMLFPQARIPGLRLPWGLIGTAAAVTAGFFLGIVGVAVRALKRKVASGTAALIGAVGSAKTELRPEGIVHVQGEEWQARAPHPVPKGARVRVTGVEGLTLHVEQDQEERR